MTVTPTYEYSRGMYMYLSYHYTGQYSRTYLAISQTKHQHTARTFCWIMFFSTVRQPLQCCVQV